MSECDDVNESHLCVQDEGIFCGVRQSGLYPEGLGSTSRLVNYRRGPTSPDPPSHGEGA